MAAQAKAWPVVTDQVASGWLRRGIGRIQTDPSDPDGATAETIRLMCGMIDASTSDLAVQQAAGDAVRRFRGGPLTSPRADTDLFGDARSMAVSVWWFAKHFLKFVHHEDLIQRWLNEADQLQLLISPDVAVHMKRPEGDCAVYTMLECALLKCLGVPFEIVTVAVYSGDPRLFSHVWPRAILADGTRLDLDASHGRYPGWHVPARDTARLAVWDESGAPVADVGPRFDGLHGYERSTVCGLGQAETDSYGYNYVGTPVPAAVDTTVNPYWAAYGAPSVATPPVVGVNQPASVWPAELANLLNAWTTIGGRVIAPTTQVTQTGPGGQSYSVTTPAGSGSSLISPNLLGSTSSSTLLWLGAAAVIGLVVLSSLSKK